ncbi:MULTISPECIES: Kelch repeat-containing protein [unclassified Sphingobacterium]|uniref:Kelch repeat-containing protein n=1 Tax=unclassified Sphingobacterium TaxID=2609468 RepID=UPI0025DDE209|nr:MULTISPECIES: kelch repeat-containing protein [unclassified Sphingobacterium]
MNKKNWLLILSALVLTVSSFSSCKKDKNDETDKTTEWSAQAAFSGDPRSGAASFVIDNKVYATTGLINNKVRAVDVQKFDADKKSWISLPTSSNFPGIARSGAVGFSIGKIGYVGSGTDDGTNALSDFYSFDSATETWKKIADLPIALNGAVAFSVGGKGYVGTGATNGTQGGSKNENRFFEYNPATNVWTEIDAVTFPNKVTGAFAFVINNVAYVGGGVSSYGYGEALRQFDGKSGWITRNSLKRSDGTYSYDLTRSNAATFAIGDNGFLVGGLRNSVAQNTTYKYVASGDYWTTENTALAGSARYNAISFAIGSNGFISTGLNGTNPLDDTWMFTPVY